jgi:Na+/H+-dicarboxylate symporter
MRKIKISLTTQIFLAMVIGVLFGYLYPQFSQNFNLFSDIFLRLIKMIIAPLVFSTLVVGIAKLGSIKSVGRIGLKTLGYFYMLTVISLVLGLLLVNYFKPGVVMQLTLPEKTADATELASKLDLRTFILHIFPTSVVDVMAKNEILPLVVFSLFFGLALGSVGDKGKPIIHALDGLAHVMFKVTSYVMKTAPFAVFGALAAIIGKQGLGVLSGYLYLIACFYGGMLFFSTVVLGSMCYINRIPYWSLLLAMKDNILLAFSTSTSESAFPKTIETLEKAGCPNKIVSFVLPMGYSFNLDASMMYMTFASVFIAQAYGVQLTMHDQFTMVLMLLFASKGIAGVPRVSLVVVAGILATFNIPVEGILLLLGIDQILDMGRAAVNLFGNAVATCVISKWERDFVPGRNDELVR